MSSKTIFDYRSEAQQGTIKLVDSKGNEKTCIGTKHIMLSNQWKPVRKADIITIEGKDYRVLKVNKNIAEVFAMYNSADEINSNSVEKYEDSTLDTYYNTTFYATLSAQLKASIVDKTFRQDSWSRRGSKMRYYGVDTNGHYTTGLVSDTYGDEIIRHCYAISMQDIIDYLEVTTNMNYDNTTLTAENVRKMIWNRSYNVGSKKFVLRSAQTTAKVMYVAESLGSTTGGTTAMTILRPAFQIDLSKIDYAIL